MSIELEINGARVIVSGENLVVSVSEETSVAASNHRHIDTKSIPEIIKAAGGAKAIHEASNGAVTRDAVYKWPSIGIPDRHWVLLMSLTETSAEELHLANRLARSTAEDAA
jgi:hypothetical protein